MRNLIDNWTTTPAYVRGRTMTVLAANPLATALSPRRPSAPRSNGAVERASKVAVQRRPV
ncbi:hypothetical protein [Umezawaea sp.]|uniref:MmyB family transcriptional regulator n=1 Tax=Umezawaea sp. TaxID=1955258 RepID=UPI002ED0D34B